MSDHASSRAAGARRPAGAHRRTASPAARLPLLPADRAWLGITSTLTLGPLDLPPLADLRRAAALIAVQAPAAHVGHRLDAARGCWLDDGLTPEEAAERTVLVHAAGDAGEVPYDRHLADLEALVPGDAAAVWVVSGDHISLRIQHATGDSGMLFGLLCGLVTTARTGEVPSGLVGPTTPWALTRTVVHHYGRTPSRLLEKAAVLRSAARARLRRAAAPVPAAPVPGIPAADAPTTSAAPAVEVAWTPRPASESAVMSEAVLRSVRRWGRAQPVPVGAAAVQVQLTHDALAAVGLTPSGLPTVLADVRRYAPEGTVVRGNFVSTLALAVDGAWSARSAEEAMDAAVAGAEPLTSLVVGVTTRRLAGLLPAAAARLRLLRPGRAAAAAASSAADAPARPGGLVRPAHLRPVVAVSTVSVASPLRVFGALPPAERQVRGRFTPGPREGMTFCFTADGRQLYVLACFDEDVFPREQVREALRLLSTSPIELLEGTALAVAP